METAVKVDGREWKYFEPICGRRILTWSGTLKINVHLEYFESLFGKGPGNSIFI